MLPKADCAFNISSLNDETELDCRLYFPRVFSTPNHVSVSGFAIFAHPYAPLGGCYDDPIVQTVGSIILQRGFVLCTFNFRGAMGSPGSTSWTGKSELADYVSVYAFMLQLMSAPELLEFVLLRDNRPLLLLGGYSYGSMIASHLPDLTTVKSTCMSSEEGSPDNEIRLRAKEIVKVLLGFLETEKYQASSRLQLDDPTSSPGSRQEIVMGGRASESARSRSRANSSRGSIDTERIRRSIDKVRLKLGSKTSAADQDRRHSNENIKADSLVHTLVNPVIAYLLVSPLLQPFSGFTTVFSQLIFKRSHVMNPSQNAKSTTQNLSQNITLAVYGDKDVFTSAGRLRKWAQELQSIPDSRFTAHEIAGAGHFWHEHGALETMSQRVCKWTALLINEGQHDDLAQTC